MVEYKERNNWGITWSAIKNKSKQISVSLLSPVRELRWKPVLIVKANSTPRICKKDTQAKNNKINLPPSIPWRGPTVDIVEQIPNNKVLQIKNKPYNKVLGDAYQYIYKSTYIMQKYST